MNNKRYARICVSLVVCVFVCVAMWFLIVPFGFFAFGAAFLIARNKDDEFNARVYQEVVVAHDYDDDIEMQDLPLRDGVDAVEDVITTDFIDWLKNSAERIMLTDGPVVKTVPSGSGTGTFLEFVSKGVRFELWVGGPPFLGPFPRLKRYGTDEPGVELSERSQVALEQAILKA